MSDVRDDSALYWGPLPKDWQLTPIKYGFGQIGSGTTPPTGQEEYFGGFIPWVTTSELRENFITSTEKTLSELALEEFLTLKLFPENTVLIAMYGATIGRVGILGIPACVNQAVCALAQPIGFEPRYVSYVLQVSREYFLSLASGGGQPNLNAEKVITHRIPSPLLPQQRAIADYLDRETAKLDALIAEKECLLKLLAEKRRALITQAVTRGLNSDVPMRDSGVEWLGEIPGHWELKRLKFISPEITVGIVVTPAKYYEDSGVPCLRSLNVRETGLTNTDLVYISPESNELLSKSKVFTGDLVAVRSGQPGTTAIVDERFDGANCIDLIIIRRAPLFDSYFLAYFLNSEGAIVQFSEGSEGAIQQHFNIETAKDF